MKTITVDQEWSRTKNGVWMNTSITNSSSKTIQNHLLLGNDKLRPKTNTLNSRRLKFVKKRNVKPSIYQVSSVTARLASGNSGNSINYNCQWSADDWRDLTPNCKLAKQACYLQVSQTFCQLQKEKLWGSSFLLFP